MATTGAGRKFVGAILKADLVIDEITTGKQYELTTAGYTIGVYMVRVETSEGVTTRTLTIQR